jgi:ABC-type polar amino acid transport system ATPase subunit
MNANKNEKIKMQEASLFRITCMHFTHFQLFFKDRVLENVIGSKNINIISCEI